MQQPNQSGDTTLVKRDGRSSDTITRQMIIIVRASLSELNVDDCSAIIGRDALAKVGGRSVR